MFEDRIQSVIKCGFLSIYFVKIHFTGVCILYQINYSEPVLFLVGWKYRWDYIGRAAEPLQSHWLIV